MARPQHNPNFGYEIESSVKEINNRITQGMRSRAYRVSNELRNNSQLVLRGRRSGRVYNVPGTGRMTYYKKTKRAKITYRRYRASAPGEPPAVRTGVFRASWQTKTVVTPLSSGGMTVRSSIENWTHSGSYSLAQMLEEGTSKMAPRPYAEKIQKKTLPAAIRIYSEPYI